MSSEPLRAIDMELFDGTSAFDASLIVRGSGPAGEPVAIAVTLNPGTVIGLRQHLNDLHAQQLAEMGLSDVNTNSNEGPELPLEDPDDHADTDDQAAAHDDAPTKKRGRSRLRSLNIDPAGLAALRSHPKALQTVVIALVFLFGLWLLWRSW